jgi:hypothetical protein
METPSAINGVGEAQPPSTQETSGPSTHLHLQSKPVSRTPSPDGHKAPTSTPTASDSSVVSTGPGKLVEGLFSPGPAAAVSTTPPTSATVPSTKSGEANLFPQVLFHVLNECSDKDFIETGIRWTHDGLQIQIGRSQFVTNTLGKFFNTTKYNSFTRNLNLYGFKKCKIYSGIYSHPDYRRDNFSLIKNMRRPKVGPAGKKLEKRGRPVQMQSGAQPAEKKQKASPNAPTPTTAIQITLPEKRPPSRPNLHPDTLMSPPTPRFHPNQTSISPCGTFHEKAFKEETADRCLGPSPHNVMDYELSMEDAAYLLSSICRHPSVVSKSAQNVQC